MDSYREHPSDFDLSGTAESAAPHDVAAAIGTDERRMHVRAYNYWVSLLDGRDFPSIEDLDSADVTDFSGHSVLLDFTCGRENPAIPYIGGAIRDECGLEDNARTIADVPSRSLLSRLTDHYMQILANRAPIGFEAEFLNQRSANICYRGILMPFSSDGEQIDFIYGVINWKTVDAAGEVADDLEPEAEATVEFEAVDEDVLLLEEESAPAAEQAETDESIAEQAEPAEAIGIALPAWGQETFDAAEPEIAEPESAETEIVEPEIAEPETVEPKSVEPEMAEPDLEDQDEVLPRVPFAWEEDAVAEASPDEVAELVLDDNAGLADRLWAARETAESVKAGEGRTRVSLYKALSLAYDVAIVAQQNPDEYADLLEESGVKAQVRAPMTPIVKLVFGVDYDKARLTEFAAALSYAQRQQVELGGFKHLIEKQPGGLKALVAAERQAKRPERKTDTVGEAARARLRSAPSMSLSEVPADVEFAVVITRRSSDGTHEAVAVLDDEALVERAIRKVA